MTDEPKDKPSANPCVESKQPKITVHLRRSANGVVIADILDENKEIIAYKHFGMMTDDEYKNGMEQVKQEFPGARIWLLVDVD